MTEKTYTAPDHKNQPDKKALAVKGNFYKQILDNLHEGVYFVDRQRHITYWNKGAERITGYAAAQVLGRQCYDGLLMHANHEGVILCFAMCPLAETLEDGEIREAEVFLSHSDGHRIPVQIRVAPMRGPDGKITGAVESFSDNSLLLATRGKVNELSQTAIEDSLTRLGNRRFLELKLRSCLAEFQLHHQPFALLFLDLDNFKKINDTHGHNRGDEALKAVANTLRHNIRATDLAGRWGGEEYMVILLGVNENEAQGVANKLRSLVSSSRMEDSHGRRSIKITLSAGVTLSQPGDTFESITERADRLMYQAKQAGRNQIAFG